MLSERHIGFLLATMFAAVVFADRTEAATNAKASVSTEAIDSALLMTKFTVLGIELSYQQSSLPRQASRSEMACINSRVTPLVRNHFDSAMKSALTLQELQLGNELASASVFPKVRRYIFDHREQLTAEAKSAKANLAYYFLITAATRTNRPVQQQNQIREFIAWDLQAHPKISEVVGNQTPKLVQDVAAVFIRCRKAP
jgi:hypothetical protein